MRYKLPEGWKEVKLGDIIQFNPRESIKKGAISKKIGMAQLTPFQRKVEGFELAEYKSGTKFKNGDTLLARITPCLENGKTAQVTILDEEEIGFGSTEYIVLREKKELSINNFIYYLATSPIIRDIAVKSMTGTSGRQRAQRDVIKNTILNLPSLPEQKVIANTLSAFDDKIDNNNKINKKLKKQAQAIFKHWFLDFDFPDETGKPYKSSGGEMLISKLGMIPEEWTVVKLEDKFNFIKGKVPKYIEPLKQDSYPYLSKAVLDGNWDEVKYGLLESGVYCSQLDVLMLMDGASSSEVFYGNDGLVGSTLSLIDAEDDNIREILYMYFSVFNDELKNQNTGSAIPHANKAYINNIKIAIPESQSKFEVLAETFKLIRVKILSNQQQNQKLSQLRDTLLPKLMSGEVRIPLELEV